MKRPSLIALVGISGLLIPLLIAQAASLNVHAGALQTWFFDVDIEPPATTSLYVEIGAYAGESGNLKEPPRTLGPYVLTEGAAYFVEYDAQTRNCPTSIITANKQVGGPFTASTNLTHILCVQRSQEGQVIIRAGAADGPIVDPTVTSSGISSLLMVQEGKPSPIVEAGETAAPEPEPSEPEADHQDDPTPTKPPPTESDQPTEAPEACAWEVHEDDDGRTYLVEVCPDDEASVSAEGEVAS